MKVTALAPSMGAEITNIDLAACFDRATGSIDSAVVAEIRSVWLAHQLVDRKSVV